MADFKIYSPTAEDHITPAVGKIKLGSSDVSKIYQGSTLVWPLDAFPASMSVGYNALIYQAWYGYYNASISPQSVATAFLPDGSGEFGSIDNTTDSVLDNNTVTSILWYGDYRPGMYPPFIVDEEVSLVLKGTSTEVTTWNTMSIQSGSTVSEYYRDQATKVESGSFTMGGGGTDDFLIYSWGVDFDTDGGPIGTGDAIIDFS